MESKDIRIKIFNNHYTLKGDDIELTEKSAQYVDTLMHKIQNDIPNQSDITIAIITALNIAEDLFKERNQNQTLETNIKNQTYNINSQIREITDFIDSNS